LGMGTLQATDSVSEIARTLPRASRSAAALKVSIDEIVNGEA
jgi:hypothetical protein